jgi:RHS repeat-associated protein
VPGGVWKAFRRACHPAAILALLVFASTLPLAPSPEAASQAACSPRPSVTPEVSLAGVGRARVTVRAGAPPLESVTIRSAANARVFAADGGPALALPATLRATAGQPIVFVVEQVAPDAAVTVPLTVTDGCGAAETFVGAGPRAWRAPEAECTPRPSITPEVVPTGPGRLQVTVRGGAPPLHAVTVRELATARLVVNGRAHAGPVPTTLASDNGRPVVFILEQLAPDRPITVPLEIVDGCGPATTFVGAGAGAWITPTPTATPGAAATPTATATVPTTPTVPPGAPPPPSPETVAPPVEDNGVTTVGSGSAFLYAGQSPVQTGVQPGAISVVRAAVLRGKITTRDGTGLVGAVISIKDRPELGQTVSRSDGAYDLAVNGGGRLVLDVKRDGYLPAQRWVDVAWQEYVAVPEIALVRRDVTTTVDLAAQAPVQVARGTVQTDADGTRQPTLLFPQGTTAQMVFPNGATQPISTMAVSATEYTVGPRGPAAMAAELPPNSGYTYMVEFRVAQAEAAGAVDVVFDPPLPYYVENFVGFPIGEPVPLGSYDRRTGTWTSHPSGRVIKIVSVTGGKADLDVNSTPGADTGQALSDLGITDPERERLATLYPVGQELWRMRIPHFDSPWDANWAFAPPPGAYPPTQPPPAPIGDCNPCPTERGGSIIEAENQVLRERLDLVGVPFGLTYSSERVLGFAAAYTLDVPLTGASLPAPQPKRVAVELHVAGKTIRQAHAAAPNARATLAWDGLDAYGRQVLGRQRALVRIGYVYDGVYIRTDRFGYNGNGVPISGNREALEVTLWQDQYTNVGTWDAREQGLGGWTFDALHAYDPLGRILYLGDGTRRAVDSTANALTTAAGNGGAGALGAGDGGPAALAPMGHPSAVAAGPDGSLYILVASQGAYGPNHIRKVAPDGIISTFVGGGSQHYTENMRATDWNLDGPRKFLTVGPDGALYVVYYHGVYRVGQDGRVRRVAGTGDGGFSGDGGPATSARLRDPSAVAFTRDGSMYITDTSNNRVRKVDADGIIATVAGNGQGCSDPWNNVSCYDGLVATQAPFNGGPTAIVVTSDDKVIFEMNSQLVRLDTDGRLRYLGGARYEASGLEDGVPFRATDHSSTSTRGMTAGPDGSIYLAIDGGGSFQLVRHIRPDGTIVTIAGVKNGGWGFNGDGNPALMALMHGVGALAYGPDGSLYVPDLHNMRVRKLAPSGPGFTASAIELPSADGSELYRFSAAGRHLQTVSTLTGATLYSFTYDGAGRLERVTDGDGNQTTVVRAGNGSPTEIVGPRGQRTALALDANGFLQSVTNPNGEAWALVHTDRGLLQGKTDPRGKAQGYVYDGRGLLTRDNERAGAFQQLARTEGANGHTVTVTTRMGRDATYLDETVRTGADAGANRRLVTAEDGTQTELVRHGANRWRATEPDGTVTTAALAGDPRFGTGAAYRATTTTATGGKTRTDQLERAVDPPNPADLLQFGTLTERARTNGRPWATTVYTRASRSVLFTSPGGRTGTGEIDAQGRPTALQPTGLAPRAWTYDDGRLATAALGSGTGARTLTLAYHPDGPAGQQAPAGAGMLASVTDTLGRVTTFAYDLAGRVTSLGLPGSRTVGATYDASGNLLTLTPPGKPAHAFTYADDDLVATYTPPDPNGGPGTAAHRTTYTYDDDRQLDLVALPGGRSIDYQYEADTGRLSGVAPSGGGATTIGYDQQGRVQTVARAGGPTVTHGYAGALLTSVTWGGSGQAGGAVQYGYDDDLRVSEIRVNGADPVAYGYDNDSLLQSVGALTVQRPAAPAAGRVSGATLAVPGHTIQAAYGYGPLDDLDSYTVGFDATTGLYSLTLGRDALGRITSRTETVGGGAAVATTYTYDSAGRLRTAATGGVVTEYEYDLNGNRTEVKIGGVQAVSAAHDAQDRLRTATTSAGVTTYTYLDDGMLASKAPPAGDPTTYTYDAGGALLVVQLPGGAANLVEYVVDGLGRRVERRKGGAVTARWLYLDDLRPVAELDGSNAVVARYVYADGVAPEYMVRAGVLYRFVTDHLGSVRLVVHQDGTVAQRIDYDPWGQVTFMTPGTEALHPFGFAGGIYDPDTKLVRFGARDYDPEVGRWTAKDPLGFAAGDTNLYAYVANAPTLFVDPTGRNIGGGGVSRLPSVGIDTQSMLTNLGFPPSVADSLGAQVNAADLPGVLGNLRDMYNTRLQCPAPGRPWRSSLGGSGFRGLPVPADATANMLEQIGLPSPLNAPQPPPLDLDSLRGAFGAGR